MSAFKRAAICLFLLLNLSQMPLCLKAGKILVWPTDFSHWINVKVIVDELTARGHNVTVITHSATPSVKTDRSSGYNIEIIEVPYTKQDVFDFVNKMFEYRINEVPYDNTYQAFLKIKEVVDKVTELNLIMCKELFAREDLLEKWRKEQFDVFLTDTMYTCRTLPALKLNLPLIISMRYSFGYSVERLCGKLPAPASYVPSVTLGFTSQMDFTQRMKNILYNLFQDFIFTFYTAPKWDHLYKDIIGR
ncbi:UDP-glucuronosyltransferase 2B17-like [Clarias gariepinus]|uniref:UDP-glucuronosyltransferase 2B17-like n=1 Tax=Clarias gariepinus TaxID=13013 RepID=UPI00234DF913|nr:UDP-glucuronosyltransferase 2B17-like [Clarias gariepinus]